MNLKYLCLPLTSLFILASLNASIFFDGFEGNTPKAVGASGTGGAASGWSRNSSTLVHVTDAQAATGSNSLFMRQGDSPRTLTLTDFVSIPDTTQDLVFSFDYYGATTLEDADFMRFEIDFGAGFEFVLIDKAKPDGLAPTSYTGTEIGLSDVTGGVSSGTFLNYSVIVPSSYYSDTLTATEFKMRFSWKSSSNGEDAYFDNISVVPEPSQFAILLGLGALFVACKRRRA